MGLGAALGVTQACIFIDDPNHCDISQEPCEAPLVCDPCTPTSSADKGCVMPGALVDQEPSTPGCQQSSGGGTMTTTIGEDSTTSIDPTAETTVDPDTTVTAGETESSSSSSGDPVECRTADGELDPSCPEDFPFCMGEMCVSCNAAGGSAACANASAPGGDVCDPESGQCVQCTTDDSEACGGTSPICGEDNLCTACTAHDQCPGGAGCHIFEGSCLPPDAVEMVPTGSDITDAIMAIGVGSEGTIRVDGGTYLESLAIPTGSVIAIIANGDVTVLASTGQPTMDVLSNGTLYLQGVSVENVQPAPGIESAGDLRLDECVVGSSEEGLISTGGRVHLENTRIVGNDGVGLSVGGTDPVVLRNVILAGNGSMAGGPQGFVTTGNTPFTIVYSTIAGNFQGGGAAISGTSGTGSVRNSILTAVGTLSNAVDFTGTLDISNSVVADTDYAGMDGNVGVMMDGDLMFDGDWEIGMDSIAQDVAIWEDGDPLTDINGLSRPNMDGAMDYAGADLPD